MREYTVKEAMALWEEKNGCKVSCTTLHKWAKKFGWVLNENRVVTLQPVKINANAFDKFLANPGALLKK